ncbi:MAG TPA: hypothetical protein DEV93_16405 [Chloroflexi bacterium]|jgi:hypothetical protein|nr:hypothetical protein [Chloroflexota bacterium]
MTALASAEEGEPEAKHETEPWAIEEYRSLNEASRHDDTIAFTIAGVFIPLSLGAVVVAWQSPSLVVPLAVASVLLYGYQLLVLKRLHWFLMIRRERLWTLEAQYGLSHHTLIRDRADATRWPFRMPTLWWWFYIALLLVWLITLVAHRF